MFLLIHWTLFLRGGRAIDGRHAGSLDGMAMPNRNALGILARAQEDWKGLIWVWLTERHERYVNREGIWRKAGWVVWVCHSDICTGETGMIWMIDESI